MHAAIKHYGRMALNYALAFVLGAVVTLMAVESMNLIQTGDTIHRYGPEPAIVVENQAHPFTINGERACAEVFDFGGDSTQTIYVWMNNSDIIMIDCQRSITATIVSSQDGS